MPRDRSTGQRLLFWAARGLTVLFALFVGVFALDVFGEGYGPWETMLALVTHLMPTLVILLLLVLTWRRSWVGGVAYPALGLLYLVMANHPVSSLGVYVLSGPLFVIGSLFLAEWALGQPRRSSPKAKRRK
jgi:hypothetical protein